MFPQLVKSSVIRSLMFVMLSAFLLSFSEIVGVDSYTIHLDDKLLLKEYVLPDAVVKNVSLEAGNANDLLKIHYDHCGRTGAERSMTIEGSQNKILKRWRFADNAKMEIRVNEILELSPVGANLTLIYSSSEIPDGKVLASVIIEGDSKQALGRGRE